MACFLAIGIIFTSCNQSLDTSSKDDKKSMTKIVTDNDICSKNEEIIKVLKEYDSRYLESIKKLKNVDFNNLFIDNADTLIAKYKFNKELLIRKNNKMLQYSEYKIDYSFKGKNSFKLGFNDNNHVDVTFYKGISYVGIDKCSSFKGMWCKASLVNETDNWKISSYLTEEDEYKFLDSLKGKTDSAKYDAISKHYDEALKELKKQE